MGYCWLHVENNRFTTRWHRQLPPPAFSTRGSIASNLRVAWNKQSSWRRIRTHPPAGITLTAGHYRRRPLSSALSSASSSPSHLLVSLVSLHLVSTLLSLSLPRGGRPPRNFTFDRPSRTKREQRDGHVQIAWRNMLSRGSFLEEKQGWYGETLISEMVQDTRRVLTFSDEQNTDRNDYCKF